MINLKIDPEFQSQIPPLTDDEFKQLEENILKEGKLLSPLIVWGNTLVDGHNRYAILQKHPEIYFSTMPLRFENREEAIAWICRNQLGRRNLSPEQKRYLLGKQYEAEKKAAKINWGGATSRRSRRSSSLESSTVWSIESPVETATISIPQPLRKPFRRNCVKLTQFLPPLRKQASASRLQSGTMSANPTLPVLKSSCGAWRSWSR